MERKDNDMNSSSQRMSRREFVASSTVGFAVGGLSAASDSDAGRGASRPQSSSQPSPRRIIIDTDPGVDDALALLFAMRSPELKIEAITAVAGNVPLELTLPNALRMVEIAGRRDIPVGAGARWPLVRKLVTATYVHGENGLDGAVFPEPTTKPAPQPAAELIREVIRKYPGEVTLITIGPLTNVATALAADPELAGMVRGLVMMGGSLSGGNITPAAEFNVYVDPEAARMVFHAGIPLTMVGLDVTRKTALTEDHLHRLEAGADAISRAAAEIARHILEQNHRAGFVAEPHMHDPLAVAGFIDPTLLETVECYVDIETSGELTAGETVGYCPSLGDVRQTVAGSRPGTGSSFRPPVIRGSAPSLGRAGHSPVLQETYRPNARVAVDVNTSRFLELFIGRLSGKRD